MYDFILILLLIISGFQNFIGNKLYSAASGGRISDVDVYISKGADVHWKNPNEYGK